MVITDSYQRYNIPLHLQRHMLLVAAIGVLVTDHWKHPEDISRETVGIMLLLHDMGNILKFPLQPEDMDTFDPSERNLDHWKQVKKQFAQYGNSTHEATQSIMKEMGVPLSVRSLEQEMAQIHSSHGTETFSDQAAIAWYADMRVGVTGLLSLEERHTDLETRYAHRKPTQWGDPDWVAKHWQMAQQRERSILESVDLPSLDTLSLNVEPVLAELMTWQL